ncbi:Hsp20/alpha crystallin family protein [Candidatus Uhrbacteria bacterium]|nr:Hsp20/alpha crystallin family protein [Candidatus Uhrbacteria bacterium]
MPRAKSLSPLSLVAEDVPYFDVKAATDQPAWSVDEEGELALDVMETPNDVVVRSAIAGVHPKDLAIHVTEDTLTIRGTREYHEEHHIITTHVQECHWGAFSRTVVLPHTVRADDAIATIKGGVLTIILPKSRHDGRVPIHPLEP